MGFKNRERILIFVSLLCVAFLVGDKFIITPLASRWTKKSASISELEQSIEKASLVLRRKDLLSERWNDMKMKCLPGEKSIAEKQVLNAISDWVRESRIGITSLKPRWSGGDDEYEKLEFRLTATGNIDSVTRFLYELESDEIAIKLEDVEISSRDKRGRDFSLSIKFSGLVIQEEEA
jgi:type II secretion system (T2SS) protein M